MKERVVDRRYDPLVWLGRKILRRDQMEGQAGTAPGGADGGTPVLRTDGPVKWSREVPLPVAPAVDQSGRLPVSEVLFNRAGASSPFGDDVTFPLPPEQLNYHHSPSEDDTGHR